MQDDYAKTAAQIRGARAILDWSQTELAERTGLTQRSIHRLEQGASDVRRSTALAIAQVFVEAGIQFDDASPGGFKIVVLSEAIKRQKAKARK